MKSIEPVNVDKYDFIRLPVSERLGVLMRADSAPAQKSVLEPADLAGIPLIVPMRRQLQSLARSAIGPMYDKFNIIATFNVVNNAALLVERDIGNLLVIEGATRYQHNPALCFRPIAEAEIRRIAVWKKYQPYNRAAALSVWFSALFLLPFRGVCLAAAPEREARRFVVRR